MKYSGKLAFPKQGGIKTRKKEDTINSITKPGPNTNTLPNGSNNTQQWTNNDNNRTTTLEWTTAS